MSYDHIDARGTHIRQSSSINQEHLGLMFNLLNSIGTTYPPTGERTLDVLWQIFICGLQNPSPEEKEAWRNRFIHFFAFTIGTLRASIYLEMHGDRFHRILDNKLTNRKWMVPVIADRFAMEERLAAFLALHDADHELRDATTSFQTKAWGTENIAEATSWAQAGGSVISELNNLSLRETTEFLHRFRRGYEDRRIMVTENEYLGSSIEDVREGDVVYMIAGTDVPFVLRSVAGQVDTFTLVGEAYIHGIMSGEGLDLKSMEFKAVTIV
jgi:molybdopterin converting factor small subunit